MKRIGLMVLAVMLLLSLGACGETQEPGAGTESTAPSIGTDVVQPSSGTEPSEKIPYVGDCITKIMDISSQLDSGNYLVYGPDGMGGICYGIMEPDRKFTPLSGYRVYYPLTGGNLLVTDDLDADRSLRADGNGTTGILGGKIIDSEGKVLFEAASNQRLHIINSGSVMVIEASPGFDGATVNWGVLDSNGQWLYPMNGTDTLATALTEIVSLDSQGSWSYASGWSAVRSPDYDGQECSSIIFCYEDPDYSTITRTIIYDAESNHCVEIQHTALSYPKEAAKGLWLFPTAFNNFGITTYTAYDINGNELGITYYEETVGGVKYGYRYNIFQTLLVSSDHLAEEYVYSEDIAPRIKAVTGFLEDQICLVMSGADGLMYFTIHDLQGNTVLEPVLLEGYTKGTVEYLNGRIFYYDKDSTLSFCALDPDSGVVGSHPLGIADYPEIWSLGNGLIAVKFEDLEQIYIFTEDGDVII